MCAFLLHLPDHDATDTHISGRTSLGRRRFGADHARTRAGDRRRGRKAPAIRQRRIPRNHDGNHHRRAGNLRPRNPRHREPRAGLDGRLRHTDPAADARDLQPRGFRPRSRGVRHRAGGHHPRRKPRLPHSRRRDPQQAAERPRAVRHVQLPHLHQDGAGPHEHQAAVPEPPSPAQLRVRLRLRRHLGAHGPGLSPGDDLRVHGRPLPQQPSGIQARGDPRQPHLGRRGQLRRGPVHGRHARRREFLRQLHRHLQRALRQPALRRGTRVLQLFPGGQHGDRGTQGLQNPLPSQAPHHPGARRRGQHRLGVLRPPVGLGAHAQGRERQLDQAPDARQREPSGGQGPLVSRPRPRVGGILRLDGRFVETHLVHRHARGGLQRRAHRRADPRRGAAHGQQRRGARRGTRAPPGGVLGAGALTV